MEKAIIDAFIELIGEKGYEGLTVGEISEQANVGRTTFYRYFQNKAQILVHLHRTRFEKMQIAPSTRTGWLSPEPPASLVAMLQKAQHKGRFRAMLYQLGKEVMLIQYMINEALIIHFESKLQHCFSEEELHIPRPILARSLAGTFSAMLQWWVEDSPAYSPEEMAGHIYELMGSMVKNALSEGSQIAQIRERNL